MILSFLLAWRTTYTVNSLFDYTFKDYGFYSNGTYEYEISIENPSTSKYFELYMFTRDEYRNSWVFDCGMQAKYLTKRIILSEPTIKINGTISDQVVLYPVFISCVPDAVPYEFQIKVFFKNPTTFLDYREVPCLWIKPTILVVYTVIYSVWILISIIKRHVHTKLNIFLYILYSLYLLYQVFDYSVLKKQGETGDAISLIRIFDVVQVLYETILLSIIIIASSGWCIIMTELTWQKVSLSILYPFIFFSCNIIPEWVNMRMWFFIIVILQLGALTMICREIYLNLLDAENRIKAHLVVISRSGFDPTTTPIFIKHEMYNDMIYIIIGSFFAYLMIMIILLFFYAPFWIKDMCVSVFQIYIFCALSYLYRSRGNDIDEYMKADDNTNDDDERMQVRLEDLDNDVLHSNGKMQWRTGAKLPREPRISSSPSKETPLLNQITHYNQL